MLSGQTSPTATTVHFISEPNYKQMIELSRSRGAYRAFSLVELLVVLAVIAILASIAISYTITATRGSQEVVARQQQAQLQAAIGSWIISASSTRGLAAARAAYTGDKLALLSDYLQEGTSEELSGNGDIVSSAALDAADAYLQFSDWTNNTTQPTVQWINK